ncbi:transcriptional regulator family: C2H2 zinc finger [Purpureocillium lilacinum]|uniref:Transcriptional regulator family: C2H2 zinc finger n=1 Tax=Purpureocillium lilacinum TaxID=33203 RepID=A0ABR0BHK3_PURLI|nr:transcriptional regulator family: C2H2 zinc finger [Purpureocillium lilacinum]
MSPYADIHNFDGGLSETASAVAVARAKRPRADRGLPPAPELPAGNNTSHPTSPASSIAGGLPATPGMGETADHVDRRRSGNGDVPKLDRSMTDVYSDELYNPNVIITSTSPPHMPVTSPTSDLFSQRINAANSLHLRAVHSPSSSIYRARSPFRNGSPFAAPSVRDTCLDYSLGNARGIGKQNRTTQEPHMLAQHERGREPETPKTISPKDAVLEFTDADIEGNSPLFPQDPVNFGMDVLANKGVLESPVDGSCLQANGGSAPASISFMPSQVSWDSAATAVSVHLQPGLGRDTSPRLSSSGSSSVRSRLNTPTTVTCPAATGAEGGTYTCTYHGCTLRFETPSLLQKHKREGHRQTQGIGSGGNLGLTSNLLNSQAGPHRCARINPSTGKPCGTIFSRPHDLTRHEDTIHNARKQKVRCDLCPEDKPFSRADALTRHYRTAGSAALPVDVTVPDRQRPLTSPHIDPHVNVICVKCISLNHCSSQEDEGPSNESACARNSEDPNGLRRSRRLAGKKAEFGLQALVELHASVHRPSREAPPEGARMAHLNAGSAYGPRRFGGIPAAGEACQVHCSLPKVSDGQHDGAFGWVGLRPSAACGGTDKGHLSAVPRVVADCSPSRGATG